MSPVVIGLALFAAVLHATWNAALRSGADRLQFVTVMSFATTVLAIPLALLLPLPAAGSWGYLTVSAAALARESGSGRGWGRGLEVTGVFDG
jgi:hypothetical protein